MERACHYTKRARKAGTCQSALAGPETILIEIQVEYITLVNNKGILH